MRKFLASSIVIIMLLTAGLILSRPTHKSNTPSTQRSANGSSTGAQLAATEQIISDPVSPTIAPALTTFPSYTPEFVLDREINPRLTNFENIDLSRSGTPGIDPLLSVQARVPTAVSSFLIPILNFDGEDFTSVNPPDTVGDAGFNHYIQMVNFGGGSLINIYDKSGTLLSGPTALDNLGSGACASGFGDPIVLYDQLADRWLLSEFSGAANRLCVYVSVTNNPVTTNWYAYEFATPNFPDYPKYGVWPDAYYVSTNESGAPAVYALDRTAMLNGNPASFQRFTATNLSGFPFEALIPSDHDGPIPPPDEAANYFARHRDDEVHNPGSNDPSQDFIEIWEFDVDFAAPANSIFQLTQNIPIAEIDSDLCGLVTFSCFPQPGTSIALDPLREVLMWRWQYRNFGTYETLVGNLVTDVDGTDHGGIRWLELHKIGSADWTLYQEGTLAPDSDNRWLGSAALDVFGNLAVGYSVVSDTQFPSIRYAGRLASDPLGTLPYVEGSIQEGTASNGSNRWGDYSALSVDPRDNCTFWYTNMYNDSSLWKTRIATFRFPDCGHLLYMPIIRHP